MAAAGASLAELRDFCNDKGIPGRRKSFWGLSTWNAILQPSVILQYCGYGVWNVRDKKGREKPSSQWVKVEKAHQALITEEEAERILAARNVAKQTVTIPTNKGRSLTSPYILSGGAFQCGRCGSSMTGLGGKYYVCGSQPYRRGRGCGRPGVYVPRRAVEAEVFEGLNQILDQFGNPDGLARQVNAELRQMWKKSTGYAESVEARKRIADVDKNIEYVRVAIQKGYDDILWANERLRELRAERETLSESLRAPEPPQLDSKAVMAYCHQTEKLMVSGQPAERKRLSRVWVQKIVLDPVDLVVKISYRLPEAVMKGVVAGAGFEPATFGL
jgi:hypothetical protein